MTRKRTAQERHLYGITAPSRTYDEHPGPEEPYVEPLWLWDGETPPPDVRATWEQVSRCLRSMHLETSADSALVRSYVLAVAIMDEIAYELAYAPAVLETDDGEMMAHPLIAAFQRQAVHVHRLGSALHLAGPSSRFGRDQVIGSTARGDRFLG